MTALSAFFYRKPKLRLGFLLSAPLLWLGLAYLGALAALFVTAFWHTDAFTGQVVVEWSLDNFKTLFSDAVYRTITFRTLGIAALVTVIDAVIAFPMAFAMAKLASPRAQRILVIAVMTPLWASYLVKAYAWRSMLSGNGALSSAFARLRRHGDDHHAVVPVAAVHDPADLRGPRPAAGLPCGRFGDLGARSFRTFRSVILPLTFPAIVAGSIFTFSLSLGDYIAVKIVGGTSQMLGNVVYDNIGAANNLPFAATVATVPVVIMLVYLAAVRRTGALDNL